MGQTLTRAHDELFRRSPDERFNTMQDLFEFCQARKERSELLWRPVSVCCSAVGACGEYARWALDEGPARRPRGAGW